MWWRIFIPSWSFFDKVGPEPKLYVLINTEWKPVELPLRQSWLNLFLNPIGNLAHARNNLYERLLLEASAAADPRALASYQLVESIARSFFLENAADASLPLKFKLNAYEEDALVSG